MNNTSCDFTSIKITEPQRECLSHILRNCEQAISGLVSIIEDKSSVLSPEDLFLSLNAACTSLTRVMNAGRRGSFCAALPEECKFASVFVKCTGIPDIGNIQQKKDSVPIGIARVNLASKDK